MSSLVEVEILCNSSLMSSVTLSVFVLLVGSRSKVGCMSGRVACSVVMTGVGNGCPGQRKDGYELGNEE